MAKAKSKTSHSRPYVFAAILLAVIYVINTLLVERIYWNNSQVSRQTQKTMNSINRMNGELQNVNSNVLHVVAGIGDIHQAAADARLNFHNIHEAMEDFESIEGISDDANRRYRHAKAMINTYNERLEQFQEMWNKADTTGKAAGASAFGGDMNALYTQDIYPLQVTAQEMLQGTIEIVNRDTSKKMAANTKTSYLLMVMMLLVAVLGEVAIFFIARRAKKARLELEEREKNLAEVDAKLKSTRQKANDLAVMNVLTGMKNRYALDNDVSERLESDRFNIAVFDMDNFRSINDTYGYDFGDEYLATVAEKLKDEFGNVAEIYNITGNEFCFLFNKEISESQAMGIVQNIQAVMSSPFEVLNLAVQLPCSGAVYHYLPGDCLNVNSLLVKLDTAMRSAKMNGGNMINTVVNI
ncbi:MAG TPA: GGDEF domain-containing protein [Ruminococcus sp.]|nr:GGDEF domain-containing protein [Ruminococcus sp.]